jgi:hypothetical protein
MKIRIKGNSVRYRLDKLEVAKFAETGEIVETTQLLGGQFKYVLKRSNEVNTLTAQWKNGAIEFLMPESIAKEWVETDEVGFQHKLLLENGESLFLLIEKDFVCIDNTFEDQSNNYPNPNMAC